MVVKQAHYEELLAEYSDHLGAIALLKRFRPYLEMIPSMRRPHDSVITIPLPIIRVRNLASAAGAGNIGVAAGEVVRLPCDVAILMCDPEWKIKTGVEIFVFIHRPQEDFSDLLSRWRQTQILVDKDYQWLMPPRHQHIFSEGAGETHPLFVVFPETPQRIERGLRGASLPFLTQTVYSAEEISELESLSTEVLETED